MSKSVQLLADIGGTNARFAIAEDGRIGSEQVLACAAYPDPAAAIEHYLQRIGRATGGARPDAASLDIAGPLSGDRVALTNHAWSFSARALRDELGLKRLILLNDFTALALSIPHLQAADLEQLGGTQGVPKAALALLGPGTGLGVSGLVPYPGGYMPLQGEGGHTTLPAINSRQARILEWARLQTEHVSAERILSGMGLELLYRAQCALEARQPEAYSAADITSRALSGECLMCREALTEFCSWLGIVAGNLALTLGAVGGVYIGGGIVPRLGNFFLQSSFRSSFEAKGRFASYLAPIPCYVITAATPALLGCLRAFTDPSARVEV
ncbi:MAG TPA: glucokinase [Steroidobacteraceae bacterium]|nr:glucokinase [Steroidobacteraceae bacterium]